LTKKEIRRLLRGGGASLPQLRGIVHYGFTSLLWFFKGKSSPSLRKGILLFWKEGSGLPFPEQQRGKAFPPIEGELSPSSAGLFKGEGEFLGSSFLISGKRGGGNLLSKRASLFPDHCQENKSLIYFKGGRIF